jgi:hypothetical protein
MSDKKKGNVLWYSKAKYIGIIIDRAVDPPERYFFHLNSIMSGPEVPAVEASVLFRPSDREPEKGKLRTALNIEILGGAR